MSWLDETIKHLKILNHHSLTHIRAYNKYGAKKYWIPATADEDSKYFHISAIVGKHSADNISVSIADFTQDQEPDSVSVLVFDFDRADKNGLDGNYLSEMAKEVEDFRKFIVLRGLKRGSLLLSGTGFHLYLPIPRVFATRETFKSMEETEKWIWEEFAAVSSPSHIELDIALYGNKVMRLAGTYNRKAGIPRMAKWIDYSGYDPDSKLLSIIKFVR